MSKSHAPQGQAGFTLIELLVIVGIGAILLFVLLCSSGSSGDFIPARRGKAVSLAAQIQTAVMNYYTEYGVYPVPKGTGKIDTYYSDHDAAAWGPMTIALCGLVDPAHPDKQIDPATAVIPNDRSIAYLNLKLSELDVSSGTGVLKLPFNDSHGNARFFCMAIDSNYDGVVGDKDQPAGKLPDFEHGLRSGAKINIGVAVWADTNLYPSDQDKMNFWVHTY